MARLQTKVVLGQAKKAWSDKLEWESLHREVYEFALPQRNPMYNGSGDGRTYTTGGQRKTDRLFDSTLPNATVRLANRLQAEITPPGRKWGDMLPGELIQDPKRKDAAMKELHGINAALFAALQLSNFDQAINEWYLELAGPGTAIMAVMEGDTPERPLDFLCIPQTQVAIREGRNAKIEGMYRRHNLMAGLITRQWDDAKNIPEGLRQKIAESPDEKVELQEALYYDAQDRTWYYEVICAAEGSGGDPVRIVERAYKNGYWVCTRWVKAAGESHGRGPAVAALPDAKTLNKLKELLLQNASMAVKGAWMVRHDAVINSGTVSIHPGAQIRVRVTGGPIGAAIQRLDVGGDLQIAQIVAEDLVNSINMIMLNRALPPDTGPVRSATEIVARLKELQQDLGAPLGRVINEGIIPMMQIALGVLGRAGIVPLMAGGQAIPLNGAQIKFHISSPMLQAQNLADVENVVNWCTIQRDLLGPEAFMLGTKIEDIGAYLAEKMNIDPMLPREYEERQNIQKLVGMILGQITGAAPDAANQNEQGGGVGAPSVPMAA